MWSYIPSCLRRHRRKIFVVGGVIGGVVVLNSYLKKKFIEWETRRTAEICDQLKRSSHFEGTVTTCDNALISFAPKIKEIVCGSVDINPIVKQLKQKEYNSNLEKIQLWEQLKVLVFTQILGEMYAQCLLTVLLRVQMSILGGYVFANSHSSNGAASNVSEQQQKYMSRIADFLANGVDSLLIPIRNAVEDVLISIPLEKSLKLQDIANIIACIRDNISKGTSIVLPDVSHYLMSTNSSDYCDHEFLEKISEETKDILECQDFNKVLSASIDRGINNFIDRLSECFGCLSDEKGEFKNLHDFAAPLAKIITTMHNIFSQHQPGTFVQLLLQQECLKSFSANIYESFSQVNT